MPRMLLTLCTVLALIASTGCLHQPVIPGSTVTSEPTNEPTPLATPPPPAIPETTQYQAPVIPYAPPVTTLGVTIPSYPRPVSAPYSQRQPASTGPEPSDPASITFQHYADQNFAVDYPATWNITQPGFVRFTSPSGKIAFTAEVSDILPGYEGNVRINPDIAAVKDMVSREFPGYDANNILSDYRSTDINGVPATVYSVRLPNGPVAYERYILISLHHVYQFTFSSDPVTFNTVAPLRDYIFASLSIFDPA